MFASYVQEAQRLKEKYSDKIHIVIGCESEMVREESSEDVRKLAARHKLSYIMGSVHHVDGVPIDYDDATLAKVENKYGSTEALFVRYFELVKQMVSHCAQVSLVFTNALLHQTAALQAKGVRVHRSQALWMQAYY